MSNLVIMLKDGSQRTYEQGVTPLEVANDISRRLGKEAITAKVNGEMVDLNRPIMGDATLELFSFKDEEGQDVFRHSSAHIMAQAVKKLWPDAKLAIGPSISNGFYYDFDMEHRLVPEDLPKIEAEMQKLIQNRPDFIRHEIERGAAIEMFEKMGENYKVELINDLPEDVLITYYDQGDFLDLCAGPHINDTKKIKAFKLMSIAGAYWRGDEKRTMLQRIYATSWAKKSQMEDYLHKLEEAKKRDHRRLGRELDLFSFNNEVAPGFPFFHGKGMIIRNELESYWRAKHDEYGYQEIRTPIIMDRALWEQSGHWEHYHDNMYFTEIDEVPFAVKPMNCPGGMLVYKTAMHSYRELPLRMCELGLVHRHEMSGALHGLMRVRAFTQDDAHIYMLPEQIEEEVNNVINLVDDMYRTFGFEYNIELSTKPDDAMGSDEVWEITTEALRNVLEHRGVDYVVNEGDGAFYGPKIDFHLRDSLDRTWQCGTIQLDMQMPERFELEYVGADGERHRPVMVHRTVLGSIERFIGVLIEHFAGAFPLWLAPVQARIIPIADRFAPYAQKIVDQMTAAGLRAELDERSEKVGFKIREAQMEKIPYMLIVGEKEIESNTVSLRLRKEGASGSKKIEEVIAMMQEEIALKAFDLN